jgi:hypothetical protein
MIYGWSTRELASDHRPFAGAPLGLKTLAYAGAALPAGLDLHAATGPFGDDREGGHGRRELVGLGEHAAGLRVLNPHAIGAGSAPGGELEAVDRAATDAALLDLEVRERGWEELWVVGAEVRDPPADLLGRGADAAFGRHVQVGHGVIMPDGRSRAASLLAAAGS